MFVLAPARQRAAAAALAGAGITIEQVQQLAAFIEETESDVGQRRKYLASVLGDPSRALTALTGLAEHLKARKPAEENKHQHMVNMPLGTTSCLCAACVTAKATLTEEPWDHDRQCRIASCLVRGDRKSPAEVAALLGVSETTLRAMLDRGAELSRPVFDLPKATKPSRIKAIDAEDKDRAAKVAEMLRQRVAAKRN